MHVIGPAQAQDDGKWSQLRNRNPQSENPSSRESDRGNPPSTNQWLRGQRAPLSDQLRVQAPPPDQSRPPNQWRSGASGQSHHDGRGQSDHDGRGPFGGRGQPDHDGRGQIENNGRGHIDRDGRSQADQSGKSQGAWARGQTVSVKQAPSEAPPQSQSKSALGTQQASKDPTPPPAKQIPNAWGNKK